MWKPTSRSSRSLELVKCEIIQLCCGYCILAKHLTSVQRNLIVDVLLWKSKIPFEEWFVNKTISEDFLGDGDRFTAPDM